MQEANLSFKTTVNKAKTLDEKNTQGKKKEKKRISVDFATK